MRNCLVCGKFSETLYCNNDCETKDKKLSLAPLPVFANHAQASKHLKFRCGTKKFENRWYKIDKNLYSSRVKKVTCKICNKISKSSENRNGYCKTCSENKEGRKNQSKILSLKYKGKNNPNYTNGKSKSNFRQGCTWKNIRKELGKECYITKKRNYIDIHHILPYSLFPNLKYDINNLIPITRHIHTELHRLQLDLLFLPNLYQQYKQDARLLKSMFANLLQEHITDLQFEKQYSPHGLLQVLPKNYHKILLRLHPEFVQQVLNQKE